MNFATWMIALGSFMLGVLAGALFMAVAAMGKAK